MTRIFFVYTFWIDLKFVERIAIPLLRYNFYTSLILWNGCYSLIPFPVSSEMNETKNTSTTTPNNLIHYFLWSMAIFCQMMCVSVTLFQSRLTCFQRYDLGFFLVPLCSGFLMNVWTHCKDRCSVCYSIWIGSLCLSVLAKISISSWNLLMLRAEWDNSRRLFIYFTFISTKCQSNDTTTLPLNSWMSENTLKATFILLLHKSVNRSVSCVCECRNSG